MPSPHATPSTQKVTMCCKLASYTRSAPTRRSSIVHIRRRTYTTMVNTLNRR